MDYTSLLGGLWFDGSFNRHSGDVQKKHTFQKNDSRLRECRSDGSSSDIDPWGVWSDPPTGWPSHSVGSRRHLPFRRLLKKTTENCHLRWKRMEWNCWSRNMSIVRLQSGPRTEARVYGEVCGSRTVVARWRSFCSECFFLQAEWPSLDERTCWCAGKTVWVVGRMRICTPRSRDAPKIVRGHDPPLSSSRTLNSYLCLPVVTNQLRTSGMSPALHLGGRYGSMHSTEVPGGQNFKHSSKPWCSGLRYNNMILCSLPQWDIGTGKRGHQNSSKYCSVF